MAEENKQLVNGKIYDWSSVTIKLKGAEAIEPDEISYDRERETELKYGKGGKPIGYGTGKKTNTVKMTLLREHYDELCRIAKKKRVKELAKLEIPVITVSFADTGKKTSTDKLKKVIFNKESFKTAEGDKENTVSLEGFAFGGIVSNDLE